MRLSRKPVHRCYTCLLNQGDHCWGYEFPGAQWRSRRTCSAFENDDVYRFYLNWQKQANVKTRKEIRQEALRREAPEPLHHLEGGERSAVAAR